MRIQPIDDLLPPELEQGQRQHTVWRYQGEGSLRSDTDQLACEMPVALEYNGISHATVLATPCDLEDFAWGFSLTEGVIRHAGDIYDLELEEREQGIVISLTIASACLDQLKRRRRALAGRTGCGLCGLESLDEVERPLAPLVPAQEMLTPAAIIQAAAQLRQRQPLHGATGATHAAAWASRDGELDTIREDVGRHNALDKLIGHLARKKRLPGLPGTGFALISSRASFEMVQKAAAAQIGALVAVSAPTQYAARMAQDLNVFLAGFTRTRNFTVYAHPEYLCSKDASQ